MKYFSLTFIAIVALILLFSCAASDDVSGTYECVEHFTEDMVGELALDFAKDGTVVMQPLNREGTYEVDGDTVTLDVGFELNFTKDGNRLTSSDGTVVYEKK